MAVVSAKEIWERRRSQYRAGILSHFLMWLVKTDNVNDGPATAISASGIPASNDAFVDSAGNVAYLSGLDCQPRSESPLHFEVQAQFDTLPDSAPPDNPLQQPPGYSWSYSNTTENYFTDNSDSTDTNALGQPGPYQVTTSAGEAFQQLPTRDTGYLTITMTRNEASHDAAADDQYSNTVNQNAVLLDGTEYAPGTLKLSPIAATKSSKTLKTGQVVVYYAKTYTFSARHQGWTQNVNDAGFNFSVGVKTNGTQTMCRIVNGDGNPVTQPWPLDGMGNAKPNATDTPAVLTFKPYTKMDWSNFAFS